MALAMNTTPLSNPSSVTLNNELGIPALKLEDVTVAYRSYQQRPTSFKESFLRFVRTGQLRHFSTFDALKNVNLTINKGNIFGIIGSNGSGKSTMLKVLAQVLAPTGGRVSINGSLASLIELGVGFDPELNAVENIYLNGSLHRKTKSFMKTRVESIIDFAELHDFASTPIKYYSSGMSARLGFAAAIDIDPDILLIDEILAVGDERFQAKCMKVFEQFFSSGKTIVIVSHNMNLVQSVCHHVALMSKGQMVYLGDAKTAVQMYRDRKYEVALG